MDRDTGFIGDFPKAFNRYQLDYNRNGPARGLYAVFLEQIYCMRTLITISWILAPARVIVLVP